MARETTSKNIDGIADLVVIAPIREGFINAYENITYATRLRVVAEALNKIRVSAREHEFALPFSDVTERILTLLDFRIGVLDKDMLELVRSEPTEGDAPDGPRDFTLERRRYLYLTATFDTALEPYMRLIWDPLGPFLDLIFCNCEGYVTAADHSCEDFLAWVRANQMDSAIFYATTGTTINDNIYHGKIDRLLRMPGQSDRELEILHTALHNPDIDAEAVRQAAIGKDAKGDPNAVFKLNELALEVLTVLFRLVDFYPPEWLFTPGKVLDLEAPIPEGQQSNYPVKQAPPLTEGKYLARVAYSILQGWNPDLLKNSSLEFAFAEPLDWYRKAAVSVANCPAPNQPDRPTQLDGEALDSEVQGGILNALGSPGRPVRHGNLLLFTVTNRDAAQTFLKTLPVHYEGDAEPADGIYLSVAFTAQGLRQIGLSKYVHDRFPKEFREGMEARSGLIGDLRENHPRRWTLPRPVGAPAAGVALPPVHLSAVDLAIQLRYAPPAGTAADDRSALDARITALAEDAAANGLVLVASEPMARLPGSNDQAPYRFQDHFGFADGVSQPHVLAAETQALTPQSQDYSNDVRRGEVLAGYRNDRMDYGWRPAPLAKNTDPTQWPAWNQNAARTLMRNGSFLVIRKLRQDPAAFNTALAAEAKRLRDDENFAIEADDIAAQIIGRRKDGTPLLPGGTGDNGFTYKADPRGSSCPFAAHIRRVNPRTTEHGRPTPRIVRRGMSYGPPLADNPEAPRGLFFMCYQASISEQFEVIQRWINGGNSTGIASFQNDPLLGVGPKAGPDGFGDDQPQPRLFQFEWQQRIARIALPKPFARLEWGLYLFTPSRRALQLLAMADPAASLVMTDWPTDFDDLHEKTGLEMAKRIQALPEAAAKKEWKRLLEDIDAKDPFELSLTPNIWSAIRWYGGGSLRLEAAMPQATTCVRCRVDVGLKGNLDAELTNFPADDLTITEPEPAAPLGPRAGSGKQPAVVVGSKKHVYAVLCDWKRYSVDEQLHRIENYSGAIYVTQQPDDTYKWYPELNPRYNYRKESLATNEILMAYSEEDGFNDGYVPGQRILQFARRLAAQAKHIPPLDYFKLELRRQYLMPALGAVCSRWFGIPGRLPIDELNGDPHNLNAIMMNGGWDWNTATNPANQDGPSLRPVRCPGDCLAPSRGTFYPRPTASIEAYAADHGPAIRKAGQQFIDQFWGSGIEPPGDVASAMFERMDDKDAVARNLIGIMVGAMPPMDGNLRGILVEWLLEKTLWRHQAAYLRLRAQGMEPYDAAKTALWKPVTRAICKRPAPDLIYRQANTPGTLDASGFKKATDTEVKEGDLVVVGLVGASQQSLRKDQDGDIDVVFGGKREAAWQGEYGDDDAVPPDLPVHACPAQKMAMGAMLGILAALLEAGEIEALPASLIVKIKDVKPAAA